MSEEKALISLDQRIVDLYGDQLTAVRASDGQIYVMVRHMCDALGLAQRVARELSQRTGRNEYGSVYGELYRRYRIPSYRELPATKYDDAIKWLGDWFQDLTGEEPF